MATETTAPDTPAVDWAAFEVAIPFIKDLDITNLIAARIVAGWDEEVEYLVGRQQYNGIRDVLQAASDGRLQAVFPDGALIWNFPPESIIVMITDLRWIPLIRALIERAKALAVITDGSERYMPEYPADLDLLLRAIRYMDEPPPTEELVQRFSDSNPDLPDQIQHETHSGGFSYSNATESLGGIRWFGGSIVGQKIHQGSGSMLCIIRPEGWLPLFKAVLEWRRNRPK